MSTQLLEPILKGGIQNTHFFNGRLLTAEALQTEQKANRQQHQQLGQAMGEGVVYGLQVEKLSGASSPPGTADSLVRVSMGLALNRKGQALFLPKDTDVSLVHEKASTDDKAGLFTDCKPCSTVVATGVSAYILALAPASGFKERAPMSGLDGNGKITGCGSRYAVEGVRFRLVRLDVNSLSGVSDATRNQLKELMTKSDPASLSKLRNWLAHLCFGTEELAGFPQDPFRRVNNESAYTTYGALDALRSLNSLTDCDVPLALIYWTTNGIQFVDMWSVRRKSIPKPSSAMWPLHVSERQLAEAESVLMQFQEQVEDLLQPTPSQIAQTLIEAAAYFRYLPPAGILPIATPRLSRGLSYQKFFMGRTYRQPVYVEGAQVEPLLRHSLSYPAIDLNSQEMVWLYKVRENRESIANATATPPQAYMIFASGHVPFYGEARFDVARWDYSNYV